MSTHTRSYETIVIGGGQAGLAAGYYLKKKGMDFVILDAGERTGDPWRARWDSLHLFTPARYCGLPGMRFPAPNFHFPSKDEMADYLETYARHFDLPIEPRVRVERLTREDGRFVLKAGGRSYEADNVVVATGAYHAPRIPPFACDLSKNILQMHSTEYQRPSQIREGDVLVVGAANSGAEIALELSRTHQTWLSGPHPGVEPTRPGSKLDHLIIPIIWFIFSRVANVKTPIGRKLRSRVLNMGVPLARVRPHDLLEAGVKRVHDRTVAVADGMPQLADGRVLDVANVIWCTGFRPDFRWIELPVFASNGYPVHERGVVAGAPGLFFVGLLFQTAASSALVGGVGRDARYIIDRLAARASDR